MIESQDISGLQRTLRIVQSNAYFKHVEIEVLKYKCLIQGHASS